METEKNLDSNLNSNDEAGSHEAVRAEASPEKLDSHGKRDVLPESVTQLLKAQYGDGDWLRNRDVSGVHKLQYLTLENPQFSIVELMIVTAIVFATLIAISKVGLGGTVACFAISLLGMYMAREYIKSPSRFRFWNQIVWGVLMPLACIFGDPFVFGSFNNGIPGYFTSHAFACYGFIGWQLVMMTSSWFINPTSKFLNEFVAGTFFAAAIFSYAIGFCLAPLAIIASVFLVGLPGWTPIITANVFAGSAKMHRLRLKAAHPTEKKINFHPAEVAGFVVAVSMALIGFGISLIFEQQIKESFGTPHF